MGVITEVLYDLYLFAFKYRFGFATEPTKSNAPALWSPIAPPAITPQTTRSAPKPSPTPTPKPVTALAPPTEKDSGYVFSDMTFVYVLPTRMFDGVLAELPFGTSFQIVGSQGKWLEISHEDIRGWVHRDDVTRTKEQLTPQFIEGEQYTYDHPETEKLRTALHDQFHAEAFDLPLTDIEYVTYKLESNNQRIAWPVERPRAAGTWQRLLKGVPGVHQGISPKTGAVIEYINSDNTGHVAYIEAVYPDASIFISEVGYPEEGRFHERTLTKDEWIELRPVFIEIS